MVQIRIAQSQDLAGVDALLARSYPKLLKHDYAPSVLVLALPIITRAKPELMQSGTYYVAETDAGEIIGAGGWTPSRGSRDQGDIRHVVTDPDHLRRGVGQAIISASLDQARADGISVMRCWSTHTAVPFYQAQGFTIRGPLSVTLAGGIAFPSVDMQQIL